MALLPVVATPVPNRSFSFRVFGNQFRLLIPSVAVAYEDVSRAGISAALGVVQRGSNNERVEAERNIALPNFEALPGASASEFRLLFPFISVANKDVDGAGESHSAVGVTRRSDGKGIFIHTIPFLRKRLTRLNRRELFLLGVSTYSWRRLEHRRRRNPSFCHYRRLSTPQPRLWFCRWQQTRRIGRHPRDPGQQV